MGHGATRCPPRQMSPGGRILRGVEEPPREAPTLTQVHRAVNDTGGCGYLKVHQLADWLRESGAATIDEQGRVVVTDEVRRAVQLLQRR
jgi:hypothetical protein